jgi:hypothetical protein
VPPCDAAADERPGIPYAPRRHRRSSAESTTRHMERSDG